MSESGVYGWISCRTCEDRFTGASGVYELSQREIEDLADEEARSMGVRDRIEAFQLLDDGKLEGTAAATIFESYRHLLNR